LAKKQAVTQVNLHVSQGDVLDKLNFSQIDVEIYGLQQGGGRMPRQARLDAPGTLHHVIVRGIEKRRIVDDQKDRESFVSRLGEMASATGTTIYAWALMTNDAHIPAHSGQTGQPNFMRHY